MEVELGRERSGRCDLKTGRGGLLDIEFAVQWLQMRHGRDEDVRTTDTMVALEALRERDYLTAEAFETFNDGYQFLRRLEQRIHVLRGAGSTVLDEADGGLELLARRMGLQRRGATTVGQALLAKYRDVTEAVRSTYLEVLEIAEERPTEV
jgi:glutamate-ammonia-ligase adenylyltransferase